ncbi:Hypothetical predicted protein, partial [Pelobates cultripes]
MCTSATSSSGVEGGGAAVIDSTLQVTTILLRSPISRTVIRTIDVIDSTLQVTTILLRSPISRTVIRTID